MARGAAARGKRIAFGDGETIIWDHHSGMIFRGNPNVAPPSSEGAVDLEWIAFYRGNRLYNKQAGVHWKWNYSFKAIPGEVFLTEQEDGFGKTAGSGFVLIEPNVPDFKTVAPNKQWNVQNYDKLARYLKKNGYDVAQFAYNGYRHRIPWARQIKTVSFRHALAAMKRARLYIGPEGGLHHGAAAVGTPAVVLFGGFIPPEVTGYDTHTNLTGGAKACGSLHRCAHCAEAMNRISVDEVHNAALNLLDRRAA